MSASMPSASRWGGHLHGPKGYCSGQTGMSANFIKKIEAEVLKVADFVLLLSEGIPSDIYFRKGGIRYEVFDSGR